MEHNFGVGESEAFARGAGGEDYGSAGLGAADTEGGDGGCDEAHSVVNGHSIVNGAAGTIYIQVDFVASLLVFEVKDFHNDLRGASVADFADEENDAVFEQEVIQTHLSELLIRAA